MRQSLQRRCLAPHARERLWRADERRRAAAGPDLVPVLQSIFTGWDAAAQPLNRPSGIVITTPPDVTALQQRLVAAEGRAAYWHTTSLLLAGLLAVLAAAVA